MELNKKNIEEILKINDDFKLCNDLIFETFFKTLRNINFLKVDLSKSILEIVDENNKPTNIKEWGYNFPKKYGYTIKLVSKNSDNLFLEFDLWESFINIYIGYEKKHFADDVEVKNNKQKLEFEKYLSLLLCSKIKEEQFYKKSNLKKIIYNFYIKNKLLKVVKYTFGFCFCFRKDKKEFIFKPWIE